MNTKKEISFEDAMKELELLIKCFEEGQMTLDQAIQAYERGTSLKKQCFAQLKQAREKIEQLTESPPQAPEDADSL